MTSGKLHRPTTTTTTQRRCLYAPRKEDTETGLLGAKFATATSTKYRNDGGGARGGSNAFAYIIRTDWFPVRRVAKLPIHV